jgi:hypothetical protein
MPGYGEISQHERMLSPPIRQLIRLRAARPRYRSPDPSHNPRTKKAAPKGRGNFSEHKGIRRSAPRSSTDLKTALFWRKVPPKSGISPRGGQVCCTHAANPWRRQGVGAGPSYERPRLQFVREWGKSSVCGPLDNNCSSMPLGLVRHTLVYRCPNPMNAIR